MALRINQRSLWVLVGYDVSMGHRMKTADKYTPAAGGELAWSEREAARRIGLSPQTLKKRRRAGTGPQYIVVGRRILYTPAHISEFLASHIATR